MSTKLIDAKAVLKLRTRAGADVGYQDALAAAWIGNECRLLAAKTVVLKGDSLPLGRVLQFWLECDDIDGSRHAVKIGDQFFAPAPMGTVNFNLPEVLIRITPEVRTV